MKSTRLFILAAISLSILCPLSAYADPRAVVHRAECQRGTADFITNNDTTITLSGNRVIQARVPAGSLDNTAGLRLSVVGIEKRGVVFDKFELKADVDEAEPSRCYLVLNFDSPGNAPDQQIVRSFNDLSRGGRGEYVTFTAQNNRGFSVGGVLKSAAILVRAEPSQGGLTQVLRLGKITIVHHNEKNSKTELYLAGTQSSCGILSAP